MANVLDVASYILAKKGSMTTMKLQKLVYYAQAWSLVWDEAPLFMNRIEAWANGPVAPTLYRTHRGNRRRLKQTQKETIDSVLDYYGKKSSQWLSNLTHAEWPWRKARKGLPVGVRGHREITHDVMMEYYISL